MPPATIVLMIGGVGMLAGTTNAVENPTLRKELGLDGIQFRPTGLLLRQLRIDWTRRKKVIE